MIEDLKKRINEHLTKMNEKAKAPYELTVSIGVAMTEKGIGLKELIERADSKLYEEKEKIKRK